MGYLRFTPGPSLQRLTWYSWDTGLTRYSSERLGFTLDARGYFGHAFVGLNPSSQGNFTRPEISMDNVLVGPVLPPDDLIFISLDLYILDRHSVPSKARYN